MKLGLAKSLGRELLPVHGEDFYTSHPMKTYVCADRDVVEWLGEEKAAKDVNAVIKLLKFMAVEEDVVRCSYDLPAVVKRGKSSASGSEPEKKKKRADMATIDLKGRKSNLNQQYFCFGGHLLKGQNTCRFKEQVPVTQRTLKEMFFSSPSSSPFSSPNSKSVAEVEEWNCKSYTFPNVKVHALICEMCQTARG